MKTFVQSEWFLLATGIASVAGLLLYLYDRYRAQPRTKKAKVRTIVAIVFAAAIIASLAVRSYLRESAKSVEAPKSIAQPTDINLADEIAASRKMPPRNTATPVYRRFRTKHGFAFECLHPPNRAVIDYWPVSFTDPAEACHDFPIIDARLVTGGRYSQSEDEWKKGLTAQIGDEVFVVIYLNNGAAEIGGQYDPAVAVAHNVSVTTNTDTTAGRSHDIAVKVMGDNIETVYGRFKINTGDNGHLEIVPNSGEVIESTGSKFLHAGFAAGNNTVNIGDLRPYFEEALFIRYRVRVVQLEK